jgi:cysteine synthase A
MKVVDSMLELIGNTPMLRLHKVTRGIEAEVLVKLECLNPSGSYKDRIALRMIEDAEKEGRLKPGYTIVESSTGNTAIALAMVGAIKGYKVKIFYPKDVWQKEKIRMLKRFGAEIETVKPSDLIESAKRIGVHGAVIERSGRLKCLEEEQKSSETWWARQFSNPSNPAAHENLAKEILNQTDGDVDAYVSSIGTGGNFYGVAKVLKEYNPNIRCIAVEPAGWEGHEDILSSWLRGEKKPTPISGGILLDIAREKLVDRIVSVTNEEARNMAYKLSREEGLYCGMSTGANVFVALREAEKLGPNHKIVTVAVDRGDRYLTDERFIT